MIQLNAVFAIVALALAACSGPRGGDPAAPVEPTESAAPPAPEPAMSVDAGQVPSPPPESPTPADTPHSMHARPPMTVAQAMPDAGVADADAGTAPR